MKKVNESTNLRELEMIIQNSKAGFGLDLDKKFEQGRSELENSIRVGNYSSVVQKKPIYEGFIKEMEVASQNMTHAHDEGQKRIERILNIRP